MANRSRKASVPTAHQVATGVDALYECVPGTGIVHLSEIATIPGETVLCDEVPARVENIKETDDCGYLAVAQK